MSTNRRLFSGLRLRLAFEFGLLALAFSFFSGSVFLNAERAILQLQEEQDVRERLALVFSEGPEDSYLKGAPLAGVEEIAWRTSPEASWQGHAIDWAAGDAAVHITSSPRWYGKAPVAMQLRGHHRHIEWRASVDMSTTADILDRTARLISFYLLLNALLLVLVGLTWLTRLVIRPVSNLSQTMASVRQAGDYRELPVTRFDELGELTRSFNDLMFRIRQGEQINAQSVEKLERAYHELSAVQEQLIRSEKLASIGRLSAGVAHEIGNPLSAISGYLRLLPQLEGAEAEEALDNASREAARIDAIIRSLLAFARSDDTEGDVVSVSELLTDLAYRLKTQPRFEGIDFELDVPSELPAVACGRGRLEQVLVNLCINAADAMRGHGTLLLRGFPVADRVILMVKDSGPGIPPEELRHIFDPFFTTKPPGEGTGLGLAISQQILSAMGGDIFADNHRDGGAVFRLELPMATVKQAGEV